MIPKNRLTAGIIFLLIAVLMRFVLMEWIGEQYPVWLRLLIALILLGVGAIVVLRGNAKIIEETTEVLSSRTKIAGGLLQSLGTAFPDMVIGVVAAVVSLQLRDTDMTLAINYAIIAASTTFGSNIYNIAHAAWCIYRQNLADKLGKKIAMFPVVGGGNVTPIRDHKLKPAVEEMDTAIEVSVALTVLTAGVAMSMVLFGKVNYVVDGINGDLYQLIRPVGLVLFLASALILYLFRTSKRGDHKGDEEYENYFDERSNLAIWISLIIAAGSILMSAESMVYAIQVVCEITKIPFVIAGLLAGIIGCLGEMIVVHNFTVNPKGRLGDAVVGVAMDNIVTVMGASIVAIMGGIFLGGNALILIFVIILTMNVVLVWQISKLKNIYLK